MEGSPSTDAYTNKEGQVSATLRLRVQSLQLLGGTQTESMGVANQFAGVSTSPQKSNEVNSADLVGSIGDSTIGFKPMEAVSTDPTNSKTDEDLPF